MATSLSTKLRETLDKLRSKGRLTEKDIDTAMLEIRMALLEADVNYKVVKTFISRTKERCLTAEVLDSLTPAQNVVKIVLEELTNLLGSDDSKMVLPSGNTPNVIMLVGLQGSGKTTAAAKLAYLLKQQKYNPMLAACDVYRPAAADQLVTLGAEIGVKVFKGDGKDPVQIAKDAVADAKATMHDVVIVDTAGRLHVDEEMMNEAVAIKEAVHPTQTLMVVDAMTGQDATNVVAAFAEKVDFDGVIMSKMDGDARGGAALSVREVTGKPIKFISEGEKPNSLSEFHPDRMAKRILGMGDVVSVVEEATRVAEEEVEQEELERLARADFTLDDFIMINKQLHKMGGASKFVASMPGGDKMLDSGQADVDFFDRAEIIINSMTREERQKPSIINGSRRARIARGSGMQVSDVNQLMNKYTEMRKVMKKMVSQQNQQQASSKKRPTKQSKGGSSRKAKRRSAKRANKGATTALGNMGNMNMGSMAQSLSKEDLKKLQDMFGDQK